MGAERVAEDASETGRITSVIICHAEEPLHADVMARWLNARTELRGIVRIHDSRGAFWRRVRREWRRSGTLGMLDILAFRVFYRLRLAAKDEAWHERAVAALRERWPDVPSSIPVLDVVSPNSAESEKFIRDCAPDVTLALSKHLLAARIFEIPRAGTFVCHAGITPEYRNAHGCFWAMANGDFEKVGMTLLRIDRGVDTGPVFGYFSYPYDPRRESHIEIQHRVVLDNLDAIADTLERIVAGDASPIPVDGRSSGAWGQPHLSAYLRLRKNLRGSNAFPRPRVS
jgi:hypothetical protein